eukprot:6479400-Amphidinium_carterae.1
MKLLIQDYNLTTCCSQSDWRTALCSERTSYGGHSSGALRRSRQKHGCQRLASAEAARQLEHNEPGSSDRKGSTLSMTINILCRHFVQQGSKQCTNTRGTSSMYTYLLIESLSALSARQGKRPKKLSKPCVQLGVCGLALRKKGGVALQEDM